MRSMGCIVAHFTAYLQMTGTLVDFSTFKTELEPR